MKIKKIKCGFNNYNKFGEFHLAKILKWKKSIEINELSNEKVFKNVIFSRSEEINIIKMT